MITVQEYATILTIGIGGILGIIGWLQIYMETYRHFPQMDMHQRIAMSVTSATIAVAMMLITVYLFMMWIVSHLIK